MCNICGHKYGSTKHLLYWQKHFFFKKDVDKFLRTWYHIINRKAYVKWFNQYYFYDTEIKILDSLTWNKKNSFLWAGNVDCTEEYIDYISELTQLEYYNEYIFEGHN